MDYGKIITQKASERFAYKSDNSFSNLTWNRNGTIISFIDADTGEQADIYTVKSSDDAKDLIEEIRDLYDALPTGRDFIDEVTAGTRDRGWTVEEWMSHDKDWAVKDGDELIISESPLHIGFKERAEKLIESLEEVMVTLPSKDEVELRKYEGGTEDMSQNDLESDLDAQMENEFPDLDLPKF